MHKIDVPHLTFEGREIESPVGLSELLESAWSKKVEVNAPYEIANNFIRETYKKPDGRWATKFEMR